MECFVWNMSYETPIRLLAFESLKEYQTGSSSTLSAGLCVPRGLVTRRPVLLRFGCLSKLSSRINKGYLLYR